MGQDAVGSQESTDAMMQGYVKNIDDFLNATTRNVTPTEQALIDSRRIINPQQQQLDLDIARQFLPQFSELGVQQQGAEQMGRARNDVALLEGPGRDLVRANLEAQKLADPEYFRSRGSSADALEMLMDSLDDPNEGLSGSERAEIDRSIARTNSQRGLEAPTATSAVESAMNFGSAGAQRKSAKQDQIAKAMGATSAVMPSLRSGVDVLQLTTGRPSVANTGLQRFGENQGVGNMATSMGGQLMGEIGQNTRQNQQINANRRTAFDSVMQTMNSTANLAGSI